MKKVKEVEIVSKLNSDFARIHGACKQIVNTICFATIVIIYNKKCIF